MKLMAENAISSFFYCMWNAWGETECKIVFGGMHKHFWEKWNTIADKAIFGAAERFYAGLSDNNREIRHLRELQEVEDLQESDIEQSCSDLALSPSA